MRRFAWVVLAPILLIAPACATRAPIAQLGHVTERHAIRVRFRPGPPAMRIDFRGRGYPPDKVERLFAEFREAIENFNRVLVDTLRRAGYEVTDNGPGDVELVRELSFEPEPRQARHGIRLDLDDVVRVVLHVFDTEGTAIDRFEFHATDGTAPLGASERVAVDLVNAMLESPKLRSYAEKRRTLGAVDKAAAPTQGNSPIAEMNAPKSSYRVTLMP